MKSPPKLKVFYFIVEYYPGTGSSRDNLATKGRFERTKAHIHSTKRDVGMSNQRKQICIRHPNNISPFFSPPWWNNTTLNDKHSRLDNVCAYTVVLQ